MEKSIVINKYLNTTTIQTWSFSAFWQKGTDLSGGRKCGCEWHILCGMTQRSRLRRQKIHVAETYKVTGDVFFFLPKSPLFIQLWRAIAGQLRSWQQWNPLWILTYTLGCFVQVTLCVKLFRIFEIGADQTPSKISGQLGRKRISSSEVFYESRSQRQKIRKFMLWTEYIHICSHSAPHEWEVLSSQVFIDIFKIHYRGGGTPILTGAGIRIS